MSAPFPRRCAAKFRARGLLAQGGYGAVYSATQLAPAGFAGGAVWGMGQLGRKGVPAREPLIDLTHDGDAEVRAQVLKVLGDGRVQEAPFAAALEDPEPRVRFFAALGLSRIGTSKDALKAVTAKDVQVDVKIDPAIIGGLVVKLGSRMVDSSLRTKLNAIKHAMKEVS